MTAVPSVRDSSSDSLSPCAYRTSFPNKALARRSAASGGAPAPIHSVMRFSQDDGWAIASHIALSILTSLFPFLIFVTALTGLFGSKSLADEVHEVAHILLQTWPPQVAAPIANEIHNVLTQTRSDLLTISVIVAIYFSSSGVEAVRTGLNRAYDVRDSRPWWLLRIESIAYVFVGAFALLTLAFLVVLAPLIWTAVPCRIRAQPTRASPR